MFEAVLDNGGRRVGGGVQIPLRLRPSGELEWSIVTVRERVKPDDFFKGVTARSFDEKLVRSYHDLSLCPSMAITHHDCNARNRVR